MNNPLSSRCTIHFPGTTFEPFQLAPHQKLADHLTAQNSPILFGCRTGICGTCLVAVAGEVPPPQDEEQELLDILAAEHPQARLACQLDVTNDIAIAPLGLDP